MEGTGEAAGPIVLTDFGFDGAGLADGAEKVVAGHSRVEIAVELSLLAQDAFADIERQNGITQPSLLEHNGAGI